jgi:hypothetical protein
VVLAEFAVVEMELTVVVPLRLPLQIYITPERFQVMVELLVIIVGEVVGTVAVAEEHSTLMYPEPFRTPVPSQFAAVLKVVTLKVVSVESE